MSPVGDKAPPRPPSHEFPVLGSSKQPEVVMSQIGDKPACYEMVPMGNRHRAKRSRANLSEEPRPVLE